MRIISGEFKGRRLIAPKGQKTRPTTDRVRESLFNWLAHHKDIELHGAAVLDLFSGTGALGLEALSRGAAHADFVENDRDALQALRHNIHTLQAEDRCKVHGLEANRLQKSAKKHDIIFMDPPYRTEMGGKALTHIETQGWLHRHSWIVWESACDEALNIEPTRFIIVEKRHFGTTCITLLHPLGEN